MIDSFVRRPGRRVASTQQRSGGGGRDREGGLAELPSEEMITLEGT